MNFFTSPNIEIDPILEESSASELLSNFEKTRTKLDLEPAELKQFISDTIKENISGMVSTPKEITINPELIKIDVVYRILNVSKVSIEALKRKGFLPFYRISNKIYFKKDEVLQAFKKSHKQGDFNGL